MSSMNKKEQNNEALWLGFLIAVCCLIPFLFGTEIELPYQENAPNTTIYLVRHADRIESTDGLNDLGLKRAQDLKRFLKNKDIQHIFSSDYNRTKQTAAPIAEALKISPKIYDAGNLPSLVKKIKDHHRNENILVVGHSNTTPEMANLFGLKPKLNNLPHETYHKIYKINLYGDDAIKFTEMEYGVH